LNNCKKIIHRKGKHIVASFENDILQSSLLIVIFPYDKVDDKFLRKLSGIKDLEYERGYFCRGSVFSADDQNLDLLVLQMSKDGSIDMSVVAHESCHCAGNVFLRNHQTVDFNPGGDELFANTVGTVANYVYSITKKFGIPVVAE